MRHLLSSLGLVLITAGASAQAADTHAGHRPADRPTMAPSPPSDTPCPCPVMKGKVADKQADGMRAPHDKGGMEHCMAMHRPDHEAGDGR